MGIMELFEEQGLLKGLARGKTEGKAEGKAETLVRLVERRYGPLSVAHRDRIFGADVSQLDVWLDRLLDAASLAETLDG